FSPYFLHKKAGWGLRLSPPYFLKVPSPVTRSRPRAKKTPTGDNNTKPFSYKNKRRPQKQK
ncbi:hypothetical protein ACVGWU_00005, partial [Enterobacter intestinihominis]